MSMQNPTGPYVFQPYGMIDEPYWTKGNIYGVGIPGRASIKGLSLVDAELILAALRKAAALDWLERQTIERDIVLEEYEGTFSIASLRGNYEGKTLLDAIEAAQAQEDSNET